MSELKEIQLKQKKYLLSAKNRSKDTCISKIIHNLGALEKQFNELSQKQQKLNEQMDKLDSENQKLCSNYKKPKHYKEQYRTLPFFEQMKIIETEKEYYTAEIACLKRSIASIMSESSIAIAKNMRIVKQIEELKDELSSAISTFHQKKQAKAKVEEEILKKKKEVELLTDICANIKTDIVKINDQLNEYSHRDFQTKAQQRDILRERVISKTDELSKAKDRLRAVQANLLAMDKLETQKLQKQMSPIKWFSERASLLARVKRARDELMLYNSLNKSTDKSIERSAMLREGFTYTKDDVKRALILERDDLLQRETNFIDEIIQTEENIKVQLEAELNEIQTSMEQIEEFRKQNSKLFKMQEESVTSSGRISILKAELESCQKKLERIHASTLS